MWLAHALLAALLGLLALAFLRGDSTWPVSTYPMFSRLRTRADATSLAVYAVGPDGAESLLPPEDGYFFRDVDAESVRAILAGIAKTDTPDAERSRRFLSLLLRDLQRDGDAASPAALRLYRVTWTFPDARDPRRRAAERTLVAEAGGAR